MADLDEALSYPVLTEEIQFPAKSRPTSGGPGSSQYGQSQYGQIVEGALRDVLGWRVRLDDPKGFTAALKQSFKPRTVDGHVEWQWTQRTYAIEADMGAVTGAQAAIYSRATAALNQSLPLLEGLRSLLPAADKEDVEAMTAIVRSSFTELVSELGQEGGPRISRVDEYFTQLLGAEGGPSDAEHVGGQLGSLRDNLGLLRRNVNTVDEEQNLTNFLILVDYVTSLKLTWVSQKAFFDREGTDVYLGTQVILLNRTLAVVQESLYEACLVLDSVFVGPAERQVLKLKLVTESDPGGVDVFLGELFDWIEQFATREGPRLINEGGKIGLTQAFTPTVERLAELIRAAADQARPPAASSAAATSSQVRSGFQTVRAERALSELANKLEDTLELAKQVQRLPPPTVTSCEPHEAPVGFVTVVIQGTEFRPDDVYVTLADDDDDDEDDDGNEDDEDVIRPSYLLVVDETKLRATFDLSDEDPDTSWDVVVINRDGQEGRGEDLLTLVAATQDGEEAEIDRFEPLTLPAGEKNKLKIFGRNFDPDKANVTVELRHALPTPLLIKGKVKKVVDSTRIVATFNLTGVSPADEVDVVVVSGSTTVTAPDQLTITAPSSDTSSSRAVSPQSRKAK